MSNAWSFDSHPDYDAGAANILECSEDLLLDPSDWMTGSCCFYSNTHNDPLWKADFSNFYLVTYLNILRPNFMEAWENLDWFVAIGYQTCFESVNTDYD
jgi:hypothetical protein